LREIYKISLEEVRDKRKKLSDRRRDLRDAERTATPFNF
jgi:hypothetical protein